MILHFENGKLINPTVFKREIEGLHGRYEVEIKKLSKRSHQQNAYYWGVVVQMIQEKLKDWGDRSTKNEIHDFLKSKFNLAEVVNLDTGEVIEIPKSTTDLTKSRFAEYVAEIQGWAAQTLYLYIPDPNQQLDAFNEGGNN